MRNQFKKIVSVVVAGAAFTAAAATSFAFTDTDSHWAKDYIDYAANSGWVNGYDDGTFRPDVNITRAEVAQVLVNMYNVTETTDKPFEDVSADAWYADAVSKAVAAGYFQGDDNSSDAIKFRPNDDVTRQEAFVLVKRACYPDETATETILPFSDSDSVASWAVIATSTLVRLGRLVGYEDNTIRPENKITRAELTKLLATIYDAVPLTVTVPGGGTTTGGTTTGGSTGKTTGIIGSSSGSSGGGGGGGRWIYTTTAPSAATTAPTAVPTTEPEETQAPEATVAPTEKPAATPLPTEKVKEVVDAVATTAPNVEVANTIYDTLTYTDPSAPVEEQQKAATTKAALDAAGITENPAKSENTGNDQVLDGQINSVTNEVIKAEDVEPILTPVYNYVLEEVTKNQMPVVSDNFEAQMIVVVDAAANKACETQDYDELKDYVQGSIYKLIAIEYEDQDQQQEVQATVKDIVLSIFTAEDENGNTMRDSVKATDDAASTNANWLTLREAFLKTTTAKEAQTVEEYNAADEAKYLANFGKNIDQVLVEASEG